MGGTGGGPPGHVGGGGGGGGRGGKGGTDLTIRPGGGGGGGVKGDCGGGGVKGGGGGGPIAPRRRGKNPTTGADSCPLLSLSFGRWRGRIGGGVAKDWSCSCSSMGSDFFTTSATNELSGVADFFFEYVVF